MVELAGTGPVDPASSHLPATSRLPAPLYWIGGGSGAGKSTVARALAARHGLRLLSTDDAMADHAARCPPQRCPQLAAFTAMTMDERWVTRPVTEMLETFHWYRGEAFDLVVEDLCALPPGPGVVVEGFRLLPRLVAPLLTAPHHAVWLLPDPAFRLAALTLRGSLGDVAGRTSDPDRALANLLERDRLFTDDLRREVAERGLRALEVRAGRPEAASADALAAAVERALGLAAGAAPA